MSATSQVDASKTPAYVWVSLLFSVVGGIVGFVGGQYAHLIEFDQKSRELDLKRQEVNDRVNAFKLDIIKQIQSANFQLADAIMMYLLEPIEADKQQFAKFREVVGTLKAEKAPTLPAKTTVVDVPASAQDGSNEFPYSSEAVRLKFSGPDRLNFRNELIAIYRSRPREVTKALLDAIVTTESGLNRYRINLYVAFTLGGIPNGWTGTPEQYNKLTALRNSSDNSDPTFRDRLDEALKNRTP